MSKKKKYFFFHLFTLQYNDLFLAQPRVQESLARCSDHVCLTPALAVFPDALMAHSREDLMIQHLIES